MEVGKGVMWRERRPRLKDSFSIQEKAAYITRESEIGVLLIDNNRGKIFEVNEVGSFIIKMCDGKNSIADIEDAICREYEVEREILEADVEKFFKRVEEYGIIEYD